MASSSTSDSAGNRNVYFWREYGEEYSCFSQWYACEWEVDGSKYRSAEEWMMVQKARLFDDEDIAQQMLKASTPKQHKALGRQVKNFSNDTWNKEKLRIVEEGNWHKFTQSDKSEELKKILLETGDRKIVEASPLDKIWGIGFGAKNADGNKSKWGQNLLGIALMNVRKRIREEEEAEAEEEQQA